MRSVFFWTNWPKAERTLFVGFLSLLAISILVFALSMWIGSKQLLQWQIEGTIEPIKLTLNKVEQNLLEVPFYLDSFRITQHFYADTFQINPLFSYLFLAAFALVWICLLSIIPALSRWWYLIATSILMAILVGFRMENLGFFGQYNHTLLALSFILFIPIGFYFHAFARHISLAKRLLVFTGLTIVFAVLVAFFSEATYPFVRLIHYGFISPLILSIAFILIVAHDIPSAILNLLTQSSSGQREASLGGYNTHFMVFTAIYLLNLFLAYLHIANKVDWGIFYIHPFIILPISAIVGIWMTRQRAEANYENLIPFSHGGGLLYLALAFISFSSLAYFSITANDPLLEVMEDMILFGHIGIGLLFMVYILANFFGLMREGQPVHKILYRPLNMPYFTARFAGMIGVTGFFFYSSMIPFSQTVAGYYNSVADVYVLNNNNFLAEQYYKYGSQYGFNNHRSNYALYSLAKKANDPYASTFYLTKAIAKNPTPFAYANLANEYANASKIFDAIFTLQQGLQKFPESGMLANNLALLFAKVNESDSTFIYLQVANNDKSARSVSTTNLAASIARFNWQLNADSILGKNDAQNNALTANKRHLQHIGYQATASNLSLSGHEQLNAYNFANIYNQGLSFLQTEETEFWEKLSLIIRDSANAGFQNALMLSEALYYYYQGNTNQSLKYLGDARYSSRQFAGYYSYLMGIMALEYQAYAFADMNLGFASTQFITEAPWALLISSLKQGKLSEAKGMLEQFQQKNTYPDRGKLIELLQNSLTADQKAFSSLSDLEKYWWISFSMSDDDLLTAEKYISQISTSELAARSYAVILERLMSKGRLHEATELWNQWNSAPSMLANASLLQAVLKMAIKINDKELIQLLINKPTALLDNSPLQLLAQAKIAPDEQTVLLYNKLSNNVLFDEGIVSAAGYFQQQTNNDKAYEILVEAVRSNPYSIDIKKAYALQALRSGLSNYAEITVNELQALLPPTQFQQFLSEFSALKKSLESQPVEW